MSFSFPKFGKGSLSSSLVCSCNKAPILVMWDCQELSSILCTSKWNKQTHINSTTCENHNWQWPIFAYRGLGRVRSKERRRTRSFPLPSFYLTYRPTGEANRGKRKKGKRKGLLSRRKLSLLTQRRRRRSGNSKGTPFPWSVVTEAVFHPLWR